MIRVGLIRGYRRAPVFAVISMPMSRHSAVLRARGLLTMRCMRGRLPVSDPIVHSE